MSFSTLRAFLDFLEERKNLLRIEVPLSPYLEITEFSRRILLQEGPALFFSRPQGHDIPVLTNLFGTVERIAWALGKEGRQGLRALGKMLADLRAPSPPRSLGEVWKMAPLAPKVLASRPKWVKKGPVEEVVQEGQGVDLARLPALVCWPEDAGPLITWGLVVTRDVESGRLNVGVYRQQILGPDRVIMRWLPERGGALDHARFRQRHPGEPFPVAVVLGADPATLLAAATPVPEPLSEYAYAGLLRGSRTELLKTPLGLGVPAQAEAYYEGVILEETALEGPFGDHTGYYNELQAFPVLKLTRLCHREDFIYHTTYTGKPPDEPAILAIALNEMFFPLLQRAFPEISDFYLPPEACSYRVALVAIKKEYPGHAKRIMWGIWSFLRQFLYTKFIIVFDDDIALRDPKEVLWAVATRVDPARDVMVAENTPMDYLDFASPVAGLGSKMGVDATHKRPPEIFRPWGRPIVMARDVEEKISKVLSSLGIKA